MIALNDKTIALNDKTYITVKTSVNQDSDIIQRILESIEVMQAKGYKVTSVGCSARLFIKIARRVAQRTGVLDENCILLKYREDAKPIPLKRDNALIYNDYKQFYLKVFDPLLNKTGTAFPTFNKPIKIGD